MKMMYVYPGTFSPPTFGHLSVVRQAAAIFPELIILCSENPEKKDVLFSPVECVGLWQSYRLPKNVKVMTMAEFKPLLVDKNKLIMIRGLRNADDLETEGRVMLLNRTKFGIKKYLYLFGPDRNQHLSSSRVRQEAAKLDLKNLSRQVSPLVISALLEKTLAARNIFLVVGRPGSGKSTFLRELTRLDANNYWLNTDSFNQTLKPLLLEKFAQEDLIQVALKDEAAMKRIIAQPWLALLAASLGKIPSGANVFVEIAYGLQADKSMFRFVGGKIIYLGCEHESQNLERIIGRGTPQLAEFIQKIPDREATRKLAKRQRLVVTYVDTNCSLESLFQKAQMFNHLISGGTKNVYDLWKTSTWSFNWRLSFAITPDGP